jgi:hypothetical protein
MEPNDAIFSRAGGAFWIIRGDSLGCVVSFSSRSLPDGSIRWRGDNRTFCRSSYFARLVRDDVVVVGVTAFCGTLFKNDNRDVVKEWQLNGVNRRTPYRTATMILLC